MHSFSGQNALDQLKWFTTLLNQHDIHYWIDSGTLLGLIREGSLLKSDPDLDIGIWTNDDNSTLHEIFEIMKNEGYRIRSHTYKGDVYSYSLMLQDPTNYHVIDIGVFREHNEYAYRASPVPKDNLLFKNVSLFIDLISKIQALGSLKTSENRTSALRIGCYNIAHTLRSTQTAELTAWPWRLFYSIGTWMIPSFYFKNTITRSINDVVVRIPNKWDEYLGYRYGNWRVPASGWSYLKHDQAFKHNPPNKIMETST